LELWKKNYLNSIKFKKKYNNKILLIDFENLIIDTENIMKKICKKININYEKSLLTPTFNSEPIDSDSSFKSIYNKIDRSVINRQISKKDINNKELKILNYYISWHVKRKKKDNTLFL